MKSYYLAYGSNLNVRQMQLRCPGAVPIGEAVIRNYRLMYKGSKTGAYLTIEKAKGYSVPVGVWEVDSYNELALDQYEGYPTFYYKALVSNLPIRLWNGKEIKRDAFVYIMHENRSLGIPIQTYIDTCTRGYLDFGFKLPILEDALKFTKENLK